MGLVTIEESILTNIADAIRAKNGGTGTYKPSEMVNGIENIPTTEVTIPDDAYTYSGTSLQYYFANDRFKWFFDEYWDKLRFPNVSGTSYMFYNFTGTEVPRQFFYNNIIPWGSSMFSGSNVEEIDGVYLNLNTTGITTISGWFNCDVVKRIKFRLQDNGSVYSLTSEFPNKYFNIVMGTNSSTGTTTGSLVRDMPYYGKIEAYETILTLPDMTQSTQTSYFRLHTGSGAKSRGDLVEKLSDTEIAVATNKGWTVAFF